MILNHDSQAFTRMYNISVPTKYAAWLELLGMYIFMPKLPLATQLCGVTAGVNMFILADKTDHSLNVMLLLQVSCTLLLRLRL